MWQPGETDEFRACDHVRAMHRHAGGKFLDYAVVNVRSITMALKKRYARQAALPVENDIDALLKMGLKVMAGNLASHTEKVRHDPDATAAVVVKLAQEGRRRKQRIIVVMHKPVTIVILAAGLGTRMKSRQAKVLHQAGGKTLLQHVVDTALELAPPERIFVVVGHQAEEVRQSVAAPGIGFIEQTEQKGTGHAVMIGPRCAGAPGRLPDGPLRRLPAAARRDAAPPDRAGDRKALPPAC